MMDVDVCVIGAGPAGSVAALRLAMLGHRVCLIERESFPRPHVGESLSGGVRILLSSLSLLSVLEDAQTGTSSDALIAWESSVPVAVPEGVREPLVLVDRGRFDHSLLNAAREYGVQVIQPAHVRLEEAERGWRIEARGRTGTCGIRSAILVDATGRRGCLRKQRRASAPPLLAVWGTFQIDGKVTTCVEALRHGWLWAGPVGPERLSVVLFCDPHGGESPGAPADRLSRALEESVLLSRYAGATLQSPALAMDATPRFVVQPMEEHNVAVGEASFSIDPLSSSGVEKSIQTAIFGAAAVHTAIVRPNRWDLCARFVRDRCQEAVTRHMEWTAEHYGLVERFGENQFWRTRSSQKTPGTGATSGAVHRASRAEVLRTPPTSAHVELSVDVSAVEEPCIVGDIIDTRLALRSPTSQRPAAFFGGLAAKRLHNILIERPTWSEFVAAMSYEMHPARAQSVALELLRLGIVAEVSNSQSLRYEIGTLP